MARPLLASGLALGLLAGACARSPRVERLPPGTPLVVISIDTLRADRLPAWGYGGVETPAIDALRREALLYRHAYTHTPLTLPAHTSLLTGLLPGEHGVRDNVGYDLDRGRVERGELPYLPRMLRDAGYATGAAVSAFVLRARTGLDAGFDFYEDAIEFKSGAGLGGQQRAGLETLALVEPWLAGVATKPFFLFFHLYEPHSPYAPPEPFASRYAAPYDGEIAAADAVVGALAAELRRLGVWERALVVLLSDHGEGLGDHGEQEHGLLLHVEDIHVPLLVKLPGGRRGGETVAAPAQLVDVAPTVAELLGLPAPAGWRGRSLLALAAEPGAPRRICSETFYPRLHFGWSDLASIVDDRHHLIDGPAPELYDLVADPGERTNLLTERRPVYHELKRALDPCRVALAPPSAVDEETRRAMAALGYLGSAGDAGGGPLPDPKSQLPVLADLRRGFQQMHDKRWAEAETTFQGLVAGNPQMIDAWEFLARARLKLGRTESALAAYQEALRRESANPQAAVQVASILFDLGRLEDAAAHARLALAGNPSFAHGLLARIAVRSGDLEQAEREARAALVDRGQRVGPLVVLAEVLHARGDLAGALDAARQARATHAERQTSDSDLLRGLGIVEGKVHADRGEVAAAESAFRAELVQFPDLPGAYSNLALLQALTGRGREAVETLRRLTEAVPTAEAYAEVVRTYRALGDERGARTVLTFARRRFTESAVLRGLETGG